MKHLVAIACLLAGCVSSLPRPTVLSQLDATRESPAVRDAERHAPQAHARAEQLRSRAESAQKAGDSASAQILGEHALVAYERAVVLSRLAAAEARRGDAEARWKHAEEQVQALDEQQKRVLSETENLELRARVLRDTLPLPSNAPSTPERERARLDASRTLALQARLLCASARLLEPARPALAAMLAELDGLDARLAKRALPAPIDEAVRLRSRCLNELSLVRRSGTVKDPATSATDRLLEELSGAAYAPARDDRGVVVTLRSVYEDVSRLNAESEKKLAALGRVAAGHPGFPVLLVLHTGGASDRERDRKRLDAAVAVVRGGGASRVDAALGGDAAPQIPPSRPGSRERNERLEIVFVSPTSS